jgi:predicted permease
MAALLLIFICILGGAGLRAARLMPEGSAAVLNRFVICVSLPAVVILSVHDMDFDAFTPAQIIAPVTLPWLTFAGAWGMMHVIGKWRHWHPHTVGCLTLTAGLGNTSFVGFPLILALTGEEGMPTAVLVDQLGTFLVMSFPGIGLAIWYAGGNPDVKHLLRKVITFPPFIALMLGFASRPFALPEMAEDVLKPLGNTLVPLALTAVGMQLRVSRQMLMNARHQLYFGLGYKLVLLPLTAYLLYGLFMQTDTLPFRVLILEAAMAPMITAGIIASDYKLRPDLAALMIGIGIPLSLITVPLIHVLL